MKIMITIEHDDLVEAIVKYLASELEIPLDEDEIRKRLKLRTFREVVGQSDHLRLAASVEFAADCFSSGPYR